MCPARRSPLHYAALTDDATEVTRLIAAGESTDAPDNQGFTPLHLAAQEYALTAAAVLIKAGASVDQMNSYGNSPLFVAVFNSRGRPAMIELLLSFGADPLQANMAGQTPVGLARLIGNYDVAQYFQDLP